MFSKQEVMHRKVVFNWQRLTEVELPTDVLNLTLKYANERFLSKILTNQNLLNKFDKMIQKQLLLIHKIVSFFWHQN